MLRLFEEHRLRRAVSLDGLWQLERPDCPPTSVLVPGVWESLPGWADYRGEAAYTRAVTVEREGPVLLRFGGVSHTAQVLWDGQPVGEHYNAFTGFDVLIPATAAGAHTLTVRVDNSFGPQSCLHVPNDYYTYGGITRPVEMHLLPDCFIERMAFYSTREAGRFFAHVTVWLKALADVPGLSLSVEVSGEERSQMVGDMRQIRFDFPVDAAPWEALHARLYTLRAVLRRNGAPLDDLIDRVGFRTVAARAGEIWLNDQPVRLWGFNRHEEYGSFGCAVPVACMAQDLQMALELGANSIRTSHYPNDQRFLDLCDEMGVLVWEEHHARALKGDILRSPVFARQIAQCNEEMVAQHVNHPCIYVWGVLNECESDTEFGRGIYAQCIGQLRELDPTRPITFASCRHFTDICLDLCDIVSWNIYPGWYLQENPRDFADRLIAWSDEHGGAGKPVIISEIGAGAIPGYHDPLRRAKWSEERQADILREQLSDVLPQPRVRGLYVWQLADVRVDESWFAGRPRTMNNKGVLDEYRRPKMACAAVKQAFEEAAHD